MGLTKSKKSESKAPEPVPAATQKKRSRKAREEEEPVVAEEDRPDPHQEGGTEEQEPDAAAKKRAKDRGYRQVAKKAGYSAAYDSGFSHQDVATPVLSEAEVVRACKWAPRTQDEAAYSGIEEFEERYDLQFHSLPPSSARVFRAHSEPFLRNLVTNAMQRASDNQSMRLTIKEVAAELRPLQRVMKYSFVAPEGLLQYAMSKETGQVLAPNANDEEASTKTALKKLVGKQKKVPAALKKHYDDEKRTAAKIREAKAAKKAAARKKAAAGQAQP